MGIRYGIDLYMPIERLDVAFLKLNQYADKVRNQPASFKLSNGHDVTTWCSAHFPPRSLPSRFTGEYVNYIAYFLFHVDSLITAYMDELNFIGRNEIPPTNPYLVLVTETGEPRFPLLLGVELALGKAFACLSVNALTYFQNEIILSSTVVHNALIEILTSADGIAGLINVESCDYPLLTDRARIISIDYDAELQYKDGVDIDEITREIQRQLDTV